MKIRFYTLTIPRILYFCSDDYIVSTINEIKNEAMKTYKKYKENVFVTVVYENDRMVDFVVRKETLNEIMA